MQVQAPTRPGTAQRKPQLQMSTQTQVGLYRAPKVAHHSHPATVVLTSGAINPLNSAALPEQFVGVIGW